MDGIFALGILLVLALIIGSILSFVNLSQISDLRRQMRALKDIIVSQNGQIDLLRQRLNQGAKAKHDPNADVDDTMPANQVSATAAKPNTNEAIKTSVTTDADTDSQTAARDSKQTPAQAHAQQAPPVSPAKSRTSKASAPTQSGEPFSLEKFLMGNGLLWLGAIVLAIGGVFLAKYSIEAGLFPPHLRIILGAAFGLSLVIAAEYLFRHPKRFDIHSPVISAALASGGLITCFAMTLVAFNFYAYLNPSVAFVILAFIAMASAWLSLRYGPILAAIGVIGAYAVPALVSSESGSVLILLMYITAVSFSAVWIHQIVKREWLWYLSALGHFVWYLSAIVLSADMYAVRSQGTIAYPNLTILLSFALISIYLYALLPVMGWNLKYSQHEALSVKALIMPRKEQLGVILPMLGIALYALTLPYDPVFIYAVLALSTFMLFVPLRHSAFDTWPFFTLALVIFAYLLMPEQYDFSDNVFPFTGAYLFIQVSALIALTYAFFASKLLPQRPAFLLLLVSAPLLMMSISYAFSPVSSARLLYSLFAIELGIVALVFAFFALKEQKALHKMSYLLLANGAVSLIFTMLLSASTLTLAIAAQIALMTSLSKRFELSLPSWIYKLAMIALMVRLSFAPWLEKYADEMLLGLHWSLVVYPLVLVLLWFARRHLPQSELRDWFTGALLHVLALFVTSETSYVLVGSYPDFANLSFEQSSMLALNWLLLGAVYLWRQQYASNKRLYAIFASLLFIGVLFMHGQSSILNNPYLSVQPIGSHPVFNWLFVIWLLPAIALSAMFVLNLINQRLKTFLFAAVATLLFLYINSVVRLSFNEQITLQFVPILQAELYTYSILWLCIAIGTIVLAQFLKNNRLIRLGFAILAAVVLKAFLIDMANLEGLFRALSFIGLGLSLVGIGWLFQRFKYHGDTDVPNFDANRETPI